MLEGDILMGRTPNSTHIVPIMAHPPNVTSDLTFRAFLAAILKENNQLHKKKGMKLDFKDIRAVEPVLRMLERKGQRRSAFQSGSAQTSSRVQLTPRRSQSMLNRF